MLRLTHSEKRKLKKDNKGFTLVETIVAVFVTGIISLLMAALVRTVTAETELTAKKIIIANDMRLVELYLKERAGGYLACADEQLVPFSGTTVVNGKNYWYALINPWGSSGYLMLHDIETGFLYYCTMTDQWHYDYSDAGGTYVLDEDYHIYLTPEGIVAFFEAMGDTYLISEHVRNIASAQDESGLGFSVLMAYDSEFLHKTIKLPTARDVVPERVLYSEDEALLKGYILTDW